MLCMVPLLRGCGLLVLGDLEHVGLVGRLLAVLGGGEAGPRGALGLLRGRCGGGVVEALLARLGLHVAQLLRLVDHELASGAAGPARMKELEI